MPLLLCSVLFSETVLASLNIDLQKGMNTHCIVPIFMDNHSRDDWPPTHLTHNTAHCPLPSLTNDSHATSQPPPSTDTYSEVHRIDPRPTCRETCFRRPLQPDQGSLMKGSIHESRNVVHALAVLKGHAVALVLRS